MGILKAPNSEDGSEDNMAIGLVCCKLSILAAAGRETMGKMNASASDMRMLKRNTNYP